MRKIRLRRVLLVVVLLPWLAVFSFSALWTVSEPLKRTAKPKLRHYTHSGGSHHIKNSSPPRLVWCFWFGPPMSSTRRGAFDSMVANLGVPVRLVTAQNLSQYNVSWDPIHPAISEPYLSGNHKADYLRAYFMRHYGGGYQDVKWASRNWSAAFNAFKDPNVWVVGTDERGKSDIGCDPKTANALQTDCAHVRGQWRNLVSNCAYIMRHSTPLAIEWLRIINIRLDEHQTKLRIHPAPYARCCGWLHRQLGYPVRWAELHGEQFHPLQAHWMKHVRKGVPRWDNRQYI